MNAIWIEIPVHDLDRAAGFYRAVFGHGDTEISDDGVRAITVIPGQPTVSLNRTANFTPGTAGPLPYLSVGEPIADALGRVLEAGGQVLEPAAARGDLGLFALVTDSEGNHLTLHSAR